jgi:hypothetical protein
MKTRLALLKKACTVLFLFLITPCSGAQTTWFPLMLPWEDSSKTFIDASDLLIDYPGQDPASVIDARGRLRASADGHFYFEKTGKRARFWGVNLTFNASFPPCPDVPLRSGEFSDVQAADKIARRLAKLGVNVVRFHHMDTSVSPDGIWDRNYYPRDTQHLDAGQIRRLDYLIFQLRKNGIYANINLKVGRHFGPGDGIDNAQLFTNNLNYFQGVANFDPRMIELQQDYARKLLTHLNPYTGKTYAEDPGVAFVEIANEDSLFGNMLNDGGLNYLPGVSGSLPDYYSRELDALWNSWLSKRYNSRETLDAAWKSPEVVADPSDKIRNGGFESGMTGWSVFTNGSALASSRVDQGVGPDGSAALRVDVGSDGTNWHVQAVQSGHSIEKDKAYEFSFYAKASSPGALTIDIMQGISPWSNYGLSKTVQLTSTWQRFTAGLRANATDPSNVRPTFELGAANNTIWIDQVEFRQTAPKGLEADEDFATGTVRRPVRSLLGSYAEARVLDLFRFYSETDQNYFVGMRRFLKDDLGVGALVTGTAPWWAYLGDTAIQSKLDYVDGHYYWDHPSWPSVPAWSATGWIINNTPWINQLQDFGSLASQAVAGKPFSVSEFNEVFPNRYALEGPLLLALVGNLQDWDALYMFDYCGSAGDYAAKYTTSFFSQSGNPIKSAQLSIAARIFLGRQSSPASTGVDLGLNPDELALGYGKGLVNGASLLESKGLDRRTFLKERLRIAGFDLAQPAAINHPLPSGSVASSNGELLWNRENSQASFMRVKGSSVQGAIGFLKGNPMDFGDWSFQVDDSGPDHLAVLLQARDGVSLRETRHMILSVWTEHQNTGMQWNSGQTSVDNRWGTDPPLVRPALINLTLRFPSANVLHLYPLDQTGNRKEALAVQQSGDASSFQIDTGKDQAVWYELELNDAASSAEFTLPASGTFQLFTDPGSDQLQLGWVEIENQAGPGLRSAALLEYATRGVLTSVVRLPAAYPAKLIRAPAIHNGLVDTAIAVLNRQTSSIPITMRILDSNGTEVARKNIPDDLSPGQARAFFVQEQFDLGSDFEGLLELSSPNPFYAITLRSIVNATGDFSLTPYPPESTQSGPVYFSHLTADSSYSSDILLWSSQGQQVTSRVEFFSQTGQPTAPAGLTPALDVTLAAGQLKRISLPQSSSPFLGYARLTLLAGPGLPAATAVIRRWENGSPASEAGIPATPAIGEWLTLVADRPGQRTGLAILNPSKTSATVDLELLGSEAGVSLPGKISLTLGAGEKRAFFLNEVFPGLSSYVTGLLHINTTSSVAILSLLGVTNARGEFLIASVTGEPGLDALTAGSLTVMPRFAAGGGYRMILYLLPDRADNPQTRGQIRFRDNTGALQPVLFR